MKKFFLTVPLLLLCIVFFLPGSVFAQFNKLKPGDQSEEVTFLQRFLNTLGQTVGSHSQPGSPGNETSYYGDLTTSAVQALQCEHGIVCNGNPESTGWGMVGPKTSALLNSLFSKVSGVFSLNPETQVAALQGAGSGLIGYWKFDEASGTSAQDASGNNNNGALKNGATWNEGKVGGSLSFDGTDDYVDVGTFSVSGNAMTISAWIYPVKHSRDMRIISKSTDIYLQNWTLLVDDGTDDLEFRVTTGNGPMQQLDGNRKVPLNQWSHVVATYDGNRMRLYQNQELIAESGVVTGNIQTGNERVLIGDNMPLKSRPFSGRLDEVRVYNRALSLNEIQSLFSLGEEGSASPLNGQCGQTVNQCIQGSLSDSADSNTHYLWQCLGEGGGTNASCSIPIPVTPTPSPTTYSLTVSKSGTGQGTITGSNSTINCGTACSQSGITSGTSITLTPTPQAGSTFTGWSGGGCSGAGSCTFTLNANTTVTAVFSVVVASPPQTTGTHYVRAGATGNGSGSDWVNAYPSLPESLYRGHTYYIADGVYGSYTFDDPVDGTREIVIKKATLSDHGTSNGWNSAYGDGQAIFTKSIGFESDHWTVDGNTPIGVYGFRVKGTESTPSYMVSMGTSKNPRSHLTIKGVELDGVDLPQRGVNGFNFTNGKAHFYNCWVHHVTSDPFAITNTSDVVIEYSHISDRTPLSGAHADAIAVQSSSNKLIIRHNIIDWNGQLIWFDGTGSAVYGDSEIYGNVFTNSATNQPPASNTGIKESSQATLGKLIVYNNTFAGIWAAHSATGGPGSVIRNNIYFDLKARAGAISFGSSSHDYNWFDTALGSSFGEPHAQVGNNPFIDYVNTDFRLKSATQLGEVLGSPYNSDRAGNIRGGDGNWDLGAYEFSGSSQPLPPPNPDNQSDTCTSISQRGIKWFFDKSYPCGQFINGDWWVVGPVVVENITPKDPDPSSGPDLHGSMISVDPGTDQGFDSRMFEYDPSLNVAKRLPLTIQNGRSLLSAVSLLNANEDPWTKEVAVLTVVSTPPPQNAFRPPHYGTGEAYGGSKPTWTTDQLQWNVLRNLAPVGNFPHISSFNQEYEQPTTAFQNGWKNQRMQTKESNPHYGRDYARWLDDALAVINFNYSQSEKNDLVIKLVQIGIDEWGAIVNGKYWRADGGHNHGRQIMVVLAGALLGDPTILAKGNADAVVYQESEQTFFITQEDINRSHEVAPGKSYTLIEYTQNQLGLAEWGIQHTGNPQWDNWNWNTSYRWPQAGEGIMTTGILANIMGFENYFNHPPLFAYLEQRIYPNILLQNTKPGDRAYRWFKLYDTYYDKKVAGEPAPVQPTLISAPVINPGVRNSLSPIQVSITSPTSGSTVYYTIDGSTPTEGSRQYIGAFTITADTIVRAIAFKDGTKSSITSAEFVIGAPEPDNGWENFPLSSPQRSKFIASYEVTPLALNIDGVSGLSDGEAYAYTDLGPIVRFSPSGIIDARNGGRYEADNTVQYRTGVTYTVSGTIDGDTQTYSVSVSSQGTSSVLIADNYSFRNEQIGVSQLNNLGLFNSSGVNKWNVKNFTHTLISASSVSGFAQNDRIKVETGDSSKLNVRVAPNTSILGQQGNGVQGTLITGPVYLNNLWWWNVDFDSGEDGWVAEDYLLLYEEEVPSVDTTAPRFLELSVSNITTTTATVDWKTDENADTQIEFGLGNGVSSFTNLDQTLSTTHEQMLTNLTPGSTYWFRVRGRDAAGNLAVSQNGTITTRSLPPVDTLAPVRSFGKPDSTLPNTATSTTLSVVTDERAVCRYSTSSGSLYDSMISFAKTDDTTHTVEISDLKPDQQYHYVVRCRDTHGNVNASPYSIKFSVMALPPEFSDTDDDGVEDAKDYCPRTPSSLRLLVNKHGCPKPHAETFDIKPDFHSEDLRSIREFTLGKSTAGTITWRTSLTLLRDTLEEE